MNKFLVLALVAGLSSAATLGSVTLARVADPVHQSAVAAKNDKNPPYYLIIFAVACFIFCCSPCCEFGSMGNNNHDDRYLNLRNNYNGYYGKR